MKERPILFSAPMVRAILEGRKSQTRRMVKPQPRVDAHRPPGWEEDAVQWHAGAPLVQIGHEAGYFHTSMSAALRIMERCSPYGLPGDHLWVRETFAYARSSTDYETGMEHCVFRWDKDELGPYDPAHLKLDPRGNPLAAELFYRADGEDKLPAEFSMPHGNEIGWSPAIHMPRWASRILLEVTDVRVEQLQRITCADCKAEGITEPDGTGDYDTWQDAYAALWESINGAGSWKTNPWVWVIEFRRAPSTEKV